MDKYKLDTKKSAIIHIVSSTKTVTMKPMRKLTILRNMIPNDVTITKEIKNEPSTEVKPEVYQQRRRMVVEYKELFAALMKLPDKEMQRKLLDVINNHYPIEYRTVETQTDPVEFKLSNYSSGNDNSLLEIKTSHIPEENIKKRKRKRKISLPQANKESRTKKFAKLNKPKAANENTISTTSHSVLLQVKKSPKRQRIDSFCISDCSSDVVNIYQDTEINHSEEILQCGIAMENGLLPIQDAVIRNQINKLNTHIWIWQSYKSVNLNDILTEEDEDLLQLAVLNTCDPSIVSLLLRKGLNPNSLDADSNTILHLAVLNDISVASLDHLVKHIDLKLVLTLNDDGYTPLHLAVRQDRYLLAERLINILDERLVKKTFYRRTIDELETNESVLKKKFKDYYENICLLMTADEKTDSCEVNNHDLKQKLLQAVDSRSGNIALYFAIDNRFEHLIYFLLAHLTDPRTENLSGIDCKTYFSEFGKSLNLSLNIDNTMEKVISLLS